MRKGEPYALTHHWTNIGIIMRSCENGGYLFRVSLQV